jgi:outer membrane protein assembly factor BamB
LNVLAFFAQRRLLDAAILLTVFLAACGPAPLGVDWASLTTIGSGQNILVANGNFLLLVDPADGRPVELRTQDGELILDDQGNPRIWEIKGEDVGNAQFYSSPIVVNDGTILVAAYNNRLFEVNIARARVENPSGDPIRNDANTTVVGDLATYGDLLYVPLSGHDLVALNRDDLSERWTAPTGHGVWTRPLIVDDVVYFSSLDHFLYAVDASTGEELWRLDLQGTAVSAPIYAPPAEEGDAGHLYIGSFARKFFDISTEGEILDEYDTRGWVWSAPTLVDGILYAADLDGWVYALDSQNGLSEVWTPRQIAPSAIRPAPLVVGDTVIVATRDGRLHWLNRSDGSYITDPDAESGSFVDRIRGLSGQIFSDLLLIQPSESLELDGPMVVVSTMAPEELLVAFNISNGQRLWSFPQ